MTAPIVFVDFAGPDDQALRDFYATVFGWVSDDSGQFSVPVESPIDCGIRKDPTEKRVYVGVPDVTASLEDIRKAGGAVDAERFEVQGVVVLGLFRDPAGNPMGLVEMEGGKPKVP